MELSHLPPAPMYSLPQYQIPISERYLHITYIDDEPTSTHYYHPESLVSIGLTLVVHFVSFDKCVKTYIHH